MYDQLHFADATGDAVLVDKGSIWTIETMVVDTDQCCYSS
jgi:hypothetical protein